MARADDLTNLTGVATTLGTALTTVDTALDNIRGYAAGATTAWDTDVAPYLAAIRKAAQAIINRCLLGDGPG